MPKISGLTAETSVAADDVVVIVDTSAGTTDKATITNLAASAAFSDAFDSRTLIATTTVAANGNVTFAAIPQTFRDLIISIDAKGGVAGVTGGVITVQFNGDTGANYDCVMHRRLSTNSDSSSGSEGQTSMSLAGGVGTSGTAGQFTIMNYASTFNDKVLMGEFAVMNSSSPYLDLRETRGRWRSTAAITSVTVNAALSGNFFTGSTMALYGRR